MPRPNPANALVPTLSLLLLAACGGDAPGDIGAFAERVSACEPAEFATEGAVGAEGRYAVEGPEEGGCRVSFTFTENPNPAFAGESLSFTVPPAGSVEEHLRRGVAECLEGRSGEYLCRGPLFVAAGGVPGGAGGQDGPLPCGEAVTADHGPLYPMPADGAWGFVDADGAWVLEPRWQRVTFFSEGRAAVAEGGRWGVIDPGGAYVIEPRFESSSVSSSDPQRVGSSPLAPFSEGCSAVTGATSEDPPFFVDREGTIYWSGGPPAALSGLNVREYGSFSEGRAWFRVFEQGLTTPHGWIDAEGELVIEPEFAGAGDFVDGLAPAAQDREVWGFVDTAGDLVLPGKWTLGHARAFSEGRAFVDLGTFDWGFIDREGNVFDSVRFDDGRGSAVIREAGDFAEGLAAVRAAVEGGTELVYIEPDGTVALVPDDVEGIAVCDGSGLPRFHRGLVRLLVADDGSDCGEDTNGLGLPTYERAHYVYLDADGAVVLRQEDESGAVAAR